MISNLGFRINKYIKVSFVIGIIDLLIFYIVGRLNNNMQLFNLIIGNWKYLTLFIAALTIIIYMFDILFFFDRKRKYKLAFIFTEPFMTWHKYLYANLVARKKDKKLNFYSDIYKKVSDNPKVMAITEDEIVIRDVYIHLITTNILIVYIIFLLEKLSLIMFGTIIINMIAAAILVNLLYRQFLKYYISEIYIDFIEMSKRRK